MPEVEPGILCIQNMYFNAENLVVQYPMATEKLGATRLNNFQ